MPGEESEKKWKGEGVDEVINRFNFIQRFLNRPNQRNNQFRGSFFDPSDGYYPGHRAGLGLPIIYTPLTPMLPDWHDTRAKCLDFEMDYYRCASRVGLRPVQKGEECLMEFEDLFECVTEKKSIFRRMYMNKIRKDTGREPLDQPPYFTVVKTKNPGHTLHAV